MQKLLNNISNIYFLGIGGIGMSALAQWFIQQNINVAGFDKVKGKTCDLLEKLGAAITDLDDINTIPEKYKNKEETIVIYTPAIPIENAQYQFFKERNFKLYKRAEILGKLSEEMFTIAIAGTHGKTTTVSLIAHILLKNRVPFVGFVGGIVSEYQTNFLQHSEEGKSPLLLVEADEFDRSFLKLKPSIALVTSVEADHLDIYIDENDLQNSFLQFAKSIPANGEILINEKHKNVFEGLNITTYGEEDGDYKRDFNKKGFSIINNEDSTDEITLSLLGKHNRENAIGAYAVCRKIGLQKEQISTALSSFKGIYRRFEIIHRDEKRVFIDDYAHHPTEIEQFINGLRENFPKKHVTVIFQPHLYTRTKDFHIGFAKALSLADRVILLEIYPAREKPIPGVTSQIILDHVKTSDKILVNKEDLISKLEKLDLEVLATVGAGNIDQLITPIKNRLSQLNYQKI